MKKKNGTSCNEEEVSNDLQHMNGMGKKNMNLGFYSKEETIIEI